MTIRRTMAWKTEPLTVEEVTGIPKYRGTVRVYHCKVCGIPGGTLVKVGDNQYAHRLCWEAR